MLMLYLFALLVGGGLLAFSLLGGDGADADFDALSGDNPLQLVSLRTLTYFLFVFGGVGAVLSWAWTSAAAPLVLMFSVAAGLGVSTLASLTFRYLRRTASGLLESEESFVGLAGRVVVPLSRGGIGKILVQRGDRAYELLARAFDTTSGDPGGWASVVIVEMSRGTALVSPLEDPTLHALPPQLNPSGDE
jgi:hypothetical protein